MKKIFLFELTELYQSDNNNNNNSNHNHANDHNNYNYANNDNGLNQLKLNKLLFIALFRLNECTIKFFWFLEHNFYYRMSLKIS